MTTENDLTTIARTNIAKLKKIKDNELFKYIDKRVAKVNILEETINNEIIEDIIKERIYFKNENREMNEIIINFFSKFGIDPDVSSLNNLSDSFDNVCVITSLEDIPKKYDNGYYEINKGKIELNKEKQNKAIKELIK